MIRGIESVLLFSQNPKKLADFYKNIVGLKVAMEGEMGGKKETFFYFQMKSGSGLYIGHHSKVKGKSKQPERYMINFEVSDIEKEVARLTKVKVKLVTPIYHVEDYGLIATFEDPDGNYFQFVQVRA